MKEREKKGSVGSSNGIAINASTGPITHSGGAGGSGLCVEVVVGALARTDNAGLSCCGADGVVKKNTKKTNKTNTQNKN